MWVCCILLLIATVVLVPVLVHYISVSSTCLQGAQEGCNVTHNLVDQLTQVQKDLLRREAQITICNQSVETLMTSLEKEKAQNQEQEKKLQDEIQNLKQQLHDAELKVTQLRKKQAPDQDEEAFDASSSVAPSPVAVIALLLVLGALWT